MKNVKVIYIGQSTELQLGLLIDSLSDFDLLQEKMELVEERVISRIINSNETLSRLGHIIGSFRPEEKALGILAITKAQMSTNGNPLYHIGSAKNNWLKTTKKVFDLTDSAFINHNFGICPVKGVLEIVESKDFIEWNVKVQYDIPDKATVINLENDYDLEKHSIKYMSERWDKYAYITELRLLSDSQFLSLFTEFKNKGGKTVYVYTTGQDDEQMYQYSKIAIEAGLKDFVFHFNSGISPRIQKFIDWLSIQKEVKVELIN